MIGQCAPQIWHMGVGFVCGKNRLCECVCLVHAFQIEWCVLCLCEPHERVPRPGIALCVSVIRLKRLCYKLMPRHSHTHTHVDTRCVRSERAHYGFGASVTIHSVNCNNTRSNIARATERFIAPRALLIERI